MSLKRWGGHLLHDVAAGMAATFLTTWLFSMWSPETPRGTLEREHIIADQLQDPVEPPVVTEVVAVSSGTPDPEAESEITVGGQVAANRYRTQCQLDQKSGEFDAVVFSASYNWELGQTDRVQLNGRPVDLPAILREEAFQNVMGEAREIVAVGAASCEVSRWFGGTREERRAMERAHQLIEWIERSQPRLRHRDSIYPYVPLSLGRYEGPCDSSSSQITSNQRRVILIAVKARDEGLDFEECLKQGLFSHPQLRVLLGNYSRFELGYDEAFGRGGDA